MPLSCNHDNNAAVLKAALAFQGVSVIIPRRECLHTAAKKIREEKKKKDDRFNNYGSRLKNVLKIAFGQSKLLREPIAGIEHFLIFWGTAKIENVTKNCFSLVIFVHFH